MGKKEESVPHLGEQKEDISGESICSSSVAARQRGRNGAPEGPDSQLTSAAPWGSSETGRVTLRDLSLVISPQTTYTTNTGLQFTEFAPKGPKREVNFLIPISQMKKVWHHSISELGFLFIFYNCPYSLPFKHNVAFGSPFPIK